LSSEDWEAFVVRLEEAGYFKYTRPEDLDEARAGLVQTRTLFDLEGYYELTGRVFPGDAERLAEGGVLGFLFQIAPFLHSQGLRGFVYLDQDFEAGRFAYSVKVNLDEYPMLKAEEWGEVMAWVAVPARAFDMVNKMLARAGSRERVYTTQGTIAQNSMAIFLTPELYDLIKNCPLLSEDDLLLTVEELMKLM
jgi:hypothetical protein